MSLSIGIVGLPNVGKSTLFNAITECEIAAENFPFCTIDPNTGIVEIPDSRLATLSDITGSQKVIPATIEFTDIAGLVKGASSGEGLGNKFLSHIRETDAIAHVVRCFEDDNIIHVDGRVDPIADAEIINLELIMADLQMAEKMKENQSKRAKGNNTEEKAKLNLLEKVCNTLGESKPVRSLSFTEDEKTLMKSLHFITAKKVIYVANVSESEAATGNDYSAKLAEFAKASGDEIITLCAAVEAQLVGFSEDEKTEFLSELGLKESGLGQLARACFNLLGLQTYLTSGEKETRAWTIKQGDTAPKAAGVIHTDFEKGFIRANIASFEEFVSCKGWKGAKEKGVMRQEGKEYIMKDGDVVEFLFNN